MKKKIYQQPQTAVVNVNFEGVLGTYTYVSGSQISSVGGVNNFLGDSDEDDNLSGTTNNSGITNSGDGSGSTIITTKKHNLWDVDW